MRKDPNGVHGKRRGGDGREKGAGRGEKKRWWYMNDCWPRPHMLVSSLYHTTVAVVTGVGRDV